MFSADDRQKAFEDGYRMALDGAKVRAEGTIKHLIDMAYIKLGEKPTLELLKADALKFLDETFERAAL